jgi:hypothetical protein
MPSSSGWYLAEPDARSAGGVVGGRVIGSGRVAPGAVGGRVVVGSGRVALGAGVGGRRSDPPDAGTGVRPVAGGVVADERGSVPVRAAGFPGVGLGPTRS